MTEVKADATQTGQNITRLKGNAIVLPAENSKMKKLHADSLKVAVHFSTIFFRYDSKNPFYHIQKVQPIMTRDFITMLASAPPAEKPGLVKRKVWIKDAYVAQGTSPNEIAWDVVTREQETSITHSPGDHKAVYTQSISTKWHIIRMKKSGNHWYIDNVENDTQ
ncbi:hypothetical protein PP175_12080 [Aneurinibacillus sp. Ricciae_BoGa-3]|uniref:hypothetical protein n=1 Tax=Aneurinibacillus sp. Ricciae_BoGa-3 TaxID=3022697 RepID=UPI00233FFB51|nr:hypothetical protein [Aneurinibacillus sp. Ricciae_BoGa-3]WCK56579.1 hypothetical protein PP175_12080 [Aneurinibacillus sp. Ricciae_BoGa-3]